MLDIKFIIANTQAVIANTKDRGSDADVMKVLESHERLKQLKTQLQVARQRSNEIAAKFSNVDDTQKKVLRGEATTLRQQTISLEQQVEALEAEFLENMLNIPNMAAPEVPIGKDESGNVVIKTVGAPTTFDFIPLDHVELGKRLDILDFEAGAKVTGSKFFFFKNEAVLLEMALIRYALDLAIEYGFTPVTTPELVRDEMILASGFNPRGPESQIYSLAEGGLSLIGTSEITIGGYLSGVTVDESTLPIKMAGVSHCFRTEAGSGGRESKGLYRVHQFTKVELYQFVHPAKSEEAHLMMLEMEERFYSSLKLPYQVLLMCKGDLGAPAYKKYDIEAWMPFIGKSGGYGEVTSTSNCTDFQARRLNTKFKPQNGGKAEFVHTLNGTAVAITRTLLAIIENNQQANGSVLIPEVIHPYIGRTVIKPRKKIF